MIDFKKELEKFAPMFNVDHIEEMIDKEDMEDLIDVLKDLKSNKEGSSNRD